MTTKKAKVKKNAAYYIAGLYNFIIMCLGWLLFYIAVCMILDFNKVVTLLDKL